MTSERRISEDFVDPKTFLDRQFQYIEFGRLHESPSKDLLRWLPTLPHEHGFYRIGSSWYVIKASEIGIPSWAVPEKIDIFLHNHPNIFIHEGGIPINHPSPNDFYHAKLHVRNFVTSQDGITEFFAVEDCERGKLRWAMGPESFYNFSIQEQLSFMIHAGAYYHLYPWEDIDDRKLESFWQRKNK